MARIDRLEAQIDRQQKRDKAARLSAARAMLNKRLPIGGATRGRRRATQVCDETMLVCLALVLEETEPDGGGRREGGHGIRSFVCFFSRNDSAK